MKIDHHQVSIETLQRIIESFVQREGTEYGEKSFTVDEKVAQVQRQLEQKKVVIVFDTASESLNIVTHEEFSKLDTS